MAQLADDRLAPPIPSADKRMRLLVDTDAANEIDDLYAIALTLCAQDRFEILGFVASHFAARSGPGSIRESFVAIEETLRAAGASFPIAMGGDPLCYPGVPQSSEGANFIVERANMCTPEDPLFVLVLGAASNIASALLLDRRIVDRIAVMFHGRSEDTWPVRTTQFNIYGDVIATKHLLEGPVPLIWFNTGTRLSASIEETKQRLAPLGPLGDFLHQYRYRHPWYQEPEKGFFDLGDVAWLLQPDLCRNDVIPAPTLTRWMYFDHKHTNGPMRFVSDIDVLRTWQLFYERLATGVDRH